MNFISRKNDFEAYLPEHLLLREKHRASARVCREELAVIDPADGYRLLVRCGMASERDGNLFDTYGIDRVERTFFKEAVKSRRRILLHGVSGELLVFADWLTDTGLLLAVLLPEARGVLVQALALIGHGDFAVSPFPSEAPQAVKHPLDDAIEHLSEIFYYLERILSPSADLGLLTRVALIGAFVGCRVECSSLPLNFPALLSGETARLMAFMLCSLLVLRCQSENVIATGEGNQVISRVFRCSLTFARRGQKGGSENRPPECVSAKTEPAPDFAYLRHSAFRDFEINVKNGVLSLEAPLKPAPFSSLLYASRTARRLRLILE